MSLIRILGYFVSEALTGLSRSWKVSVLAVLTIATSVFIGGLFLLLGSNLERTIEAWRHEAKILVYFRSGASTAERQAVKARAEAQHWVTAVTEVSEAMAEERFRSTFPSLGQLLEDWEEEPLPAWLEISFASGVVPAGPEFEAWLETLHSESAVSLVDDDRDWLRQLEVVVAMLEGLGLVLGTALLGAAMVTIASVIRLTAYLYREEIAVMRLVGATELYIRGPFYVEGLVQGFLGGALALGGLYALYAGLGRRGGSHQLLDGLLVNGFLSWQSILVLLAIATVAGSVGAVLSLRGETLAAD